MSLQLILATDAAAITVALAEGEEVELVDDRLPALRRPPDPDAASLRLRAREGVLELEARVPVLLNEVQLRGPASARPGDVIRLGATTVLVQRASVPALASVGLPHDAFVALVDRALDEQPERTCAIAVVRVSDAQLQRALQARLSALEAPAPLLGQLAPGVLEVGLLGAEGPRFRRALAAIAEPLGTAASRALGVARSPRDGATALKLLSRALLRLGLGESEPASLDEPVASDPSTVALAALIERYARAGRSLALFGETGVGKVTWATTVLRRLGSLPVPVGEPLSLDLLEDRLRAARDGWLLLLSPERWPESMQRALADRLEGGAAVRQLAVTSAPPVALVERGALHPRLATLLGPIALRVPPLRDRPDDVLPLAEGVLARARAAWGRPVLGFAAATRQALQAYPWPENLPELEVAVLRAALAAPSDELRPQDLPPELQHAAGTAAAGVRAQLKDAERDAYLAALARTRWNVTEAARQLGLPRRTVVYRMRRLGLRRPTPAGR